MLAARAAVDVQAFFAPLVIFPLLTGIGLGAVLTGLMRVGQVGHRPTIILGAVLAVLTTVAGEHYFCYLSTRSAEPEQSQLAEKARQVFPDLLAGRLQTQPSNFADFIRQQADRGRPLLFGLIGRGWIAWLSWAIDGLLVLAGAAAVLIPAMLLPYCRQCQTWHRAIRGAKITGSAVTEIGRIVDVDLVENIKSGHCRLISCHRGCGPTGCELYWESTDGDTYFARVWLDAQRTRQSNAIARSGDRTGGKTKSVKNISHCDGSRSPVPPDTSGGGRTTAAPINARFFCYVARSIIKPNRDGKIAAPTTYLRSSTTR